MSRGGRSTLSSMTSKLTGFILHQKQNVHFHQSALWSSTWSSYCILRGCDCVWNFLPTLFHRRFEFDVSLEEAQARKLDVSVKNGKMFHSRERKDIGMVCIAACDRLRSRHKILKALGSWNVVSVTGDTDIQPLHFQLWLIMIQCSECFYFIHILQNQCLDHCSCHTFPVCDPRLGNWLNFQVLLLSTGDDRFFTVGSCQRHHRMVWAPCFTFPRFEWNSSCKKLFWMSLMCYIRPKVKYAELKHQYFLPSLYTFFCTCFFVQDRKSCLTSIVRLFLGNTVITFLQELEEKIDTTLIYVK